ncbi:SPOR domain-containing protein [Parvibaculum sp. MBR-TMA-1.3b-4.2]|jgi:hypothetical protein
MTIRPVPGAIAAVLIMVPLSLGLSACSERAAGAGVPTEQDKAEAAADRAPPAKSVERRLDRLEARVATLDRKYTVIEPVLTDLKASDRSMNNRLGTLEAGLGFTTASISPRQKQQPAAKPVTLDIRPTLTDGADDGRNRSGWAVHLASYLDAANIEKGKRILSTRYPDMLSGRGWTTMRYESRDGKVYTRLLTDPLSSREAAETLCAQLKARGKDCRALKLGDANG